MNMYLISFIIYALALIGIGIYSYFQADSSGDFLLGGRSTNYWVTAISAHASDMSSWLFLGLPGALYSSGLMHVWSVVGLVLGMWATWHFVAPHIREKSAKLNALTFSSYLERACHDTTGSIRTVSSLLILFFFTFYIASGLKGIGMILDSTFHVPYELGIIIGSVLVVTYTLLGGYVAVTLTDFFQGVFLLFMIITVPIAAWMKIGGWSSIVASARITGASLSLFPTTGEHPVLFALGTALSWGLGYFGLPHVLVKFMGIDDPKNMWRAQWVGLTWQILVMSAAVATGLTGIAFFNGALHNNEYVFITMVQELFSPLFGGFIICAIFAATLSTVDSQILVASSVIANDIYRGSRHTVAMLRGGMIALTLVSLAIAAFDTSSLYEIVRYAWAGLGGTFGPVVLMSIYFPAITPAGALCGLVTGAGISAAWHVLVPALSSYSVIVAFAANIIMIGFISQVTKRKTV